MQTHARRYIIQREYTPRGRNYIERKVPVDEMPAILSRSGSASSMTSASGARARGRGAGNPYGNPNGRGRGGGRGSGDGYAPKPTKKATVHI